MCNMRTIVLDYYSLQYKITPPWFITPSSPSGIPSLSFPYIQLGNTIWVQVHPTSLHIFAGFAWMGMTVMRFCSLENAWKSGFVSLFLLFICIRFCLPIHADISYSSL